MNEYVFSEYHRRIIDAANLASERSAARIQSSWKCLQSRLLEAGFVENGTIHNGLKRFTGTKESYDKLFTLIHKVTRYKDQVYFHHYDKSNQTKIIVQSYDGGVSYDAWCA